MIHAILRVLGLGHTHDTYRVRVDGVLHLACHGCAYLAPVGMDDAQKAARLKRLAAKSKKQIVVKQPRGRDRVVAMPQRRTP